ncbi:MAG: hypothetical protein J7L14_01020 [Candidatus Diapherotrites archaeon]|nr:hypothetical protein [Candidatus Diapherotrites archaeon]
MSFDAMDSKEYDAFCKECKQLFLKKSREYSAEPIKAVGLTGVMVRLLEKSYRFKNLLAKRRKNKSAIEDTLKDVVNLGIIGLWLLRRKR